MKIIILILLCVMTLLTAQPQFDGYLQNWTAIRADEDPDYMMLRNRFRLNTTISGDWTRGYASFDVSDDLLIEGSPEMTLRELFLDIYFDKVDLRIGKQQVVWGKADGVFINDIVNPLDFRYFLLQDFEDIRIGIPMVKASVYTETLVLEAIWIPKFEPWRFAEQGSDWAFYQPQAFITPTGVEIPLAWGKSEEPPSKLQNSEYGLKLSGFAFGTDYSLLFLQSYQDQYLVEIDIDTLDLNSVPDTIKMHPYFKRVNMYGLNFSKPVLGAVFRGEFGYFPDYYFNVDPKVTFSTIVFDDNTCMLGYFQGMLGLDISGPWGSTISTQYIRKQILDYVDTIQKANEVEEWMTLMISGTFWNETASARWLMLYDTTEESGLSRMIFGYEIADNVSAEFGVDLIWGNEENIFGQFDSNDNVYFKLMYSF